MTSSSLWRLLPPELGDLLEPELPALSREVIEAIGREVPEYARPLEGGFGRAVRSGVEEALARFLRLLRERGGEAGADSSVYVALGRQEFREGRTLDALQAAYRVGARVAWRRLARACSAAGVEGEPLALLAEAIFAYIDELSAESVEGYAQAQAERAGERERARAQLVQALIAGAPPEETAPLCAAARVRLPARAAALACPAQALPGLARRLGPEVLASPLHGVGCLVVGDAEGPGRREGVRAALREGRAAVGPEGPPGRLPRSWALARPALELASDPGLVVADEHLSGLMLAASGVVVQRIAERRLQGLEGLTPAARGRMAATALAFVRHEGNAARMARALHVHPQTARYRLARLRELLGDQLDDPDARFELQAALLWQAAQGAQGAAPGSAGV